MSFSQRCLRSHLYSLLCWQVLIGLNLGLGPQQESKTLDGAWPGLQRRWECPSSSTPLLRSGRQSLPPISSWEKMKSLPWIACSGSAIFWTSQWQQQVRAIWCWAELEAWIPRYYYSLCPFHVQKYHIRSICTCNLCIIFLWESNARFWWWWLLQCSLQMRHPSYASICLCAFEDIRPRRPERRLQRTLLHVPFPGGTGSLLHNIRCHGELIPAGASRPTDHRPRDCGPRNSERGGLWGTGESGAHGELQAMAGTHHASWFSAGSHISRDLEQNQDGHENIPPRLRRWRGRKLVFVRLEKPHHSGYDRLGTRPGQQPVGGWVFTTFSFWGWGIGILFHVPWFLVWPRCGAALQQQHCSKLVYIPGIRHTLLEVVVNAWTL